jgi:nicotinamidase-related amidase
MGDKLGTRHTRAGLTRERAVVPGRTALLVVDVRNFTFNEAQRAIRSEFHAAAEVRVIPNLVKLIAACRGAGVELMYTVIENATADGRDRSLDYKLSDLFVARGSWEAHVLARIVPEADEIELPKTSSSVFNSTNIDYLLRNMGIDDLVVTGFLTDQ